jgi:hypothetical protein
MLSTVRARAGLELLSIFGPKSVLRDRTVFYNGPVLRFGPNFHFRIFQLTFSFLVFSSFLEIKKKA